MLVVDDGILRIGSSNLNNRSLGFDSECDLAFDAAGREEVRLAIRRFRNRLLGEHLGMSGEAVAEAITDPRIADQGNRKAAGQYPDAAQSSG